MFDVILHGPDDVNSALERLNLGESVLLVAGEQHRRPKSWLIHDVVAASQKHGALVHRPEWVTRGVVRRQCYMKRCVIVPKTDGIDPSGVREPRVPISDPPVINEALEPPAR